MKIKFCALLLIMCLVPFTPVIAETEVLHPFDPDACAELVLYGGFEEVGKNQEILDWNTYPSPTAVESSTTEKHSGERSAHLLGTSPAVGKNIAGFLEQTEYQLTVWIKPMKATDYPGIKIAFSSADGYLSGEDAVSNYKGVLKAGQWNEVSFLFVTPKDATKISLMLRAYDEDADVYYDDLSIKGLTKEIFAMQNLQVNADIETPAVLMEALGDNLINNSSFEDVYDSTVTAGYKEAQNWKRNQSVNTDGVPYVTVTDEVARTGKYSAKISTDTSNVPYILTEVPVEACATYETSVWLNIPVGAKFGWKYEFFSEKPFTSDTLVRFERRGAENSTYYQEATTGWVQFSDTMIVPTGAKYLQLLLRIWDMGTMFMDDAACCKVAEPYSFWLDTNDVFYYTEDELGTATVTPSVTVFPELANSTVGFKLMKGDTVVREQAPVATNGAPVQWHFYMDWLTEKKTAYDIVATIYDGSGAAVETRTVDIYKYDKPLLLDDFGTRTENGEQFVVMGIDHSLRDYQWDQFPQIGANAATSFVSQKELDSAQARGMKVMFALYNSMLPGTHPKNLQTTIDAVKAYKDHPAVYGWLLMDEYTSFYPSSYDYLKDAYILIRGMDDKHPILQCEANFLKAETYKYSDIYIFDPYATNKHPWASYYADCSVTVQENTGYGKPLMPVSQTFEYAGTWPNDATIRSMYYQSMFTGATGYRHHRWTFQTELPQSDIWDEMSRMKNEYPDANNHFIYRKYPIFAEARTEEAWWSLFVKDGAIYGFVLNRDKQDKTVEIPLVSDSKTVSLAGFSAEILGGGGIGTKLTGTDTLSLPLPGDDALYIKITPNEATDFSSLKKIRYRDTATHPWAAAQIAAIDEKGITKGLESGYADNYFRPSLPITRGDFAMFLIRTLGLTADTTDQFADVYENAHFAKELAIGKSLGILNGVGDNKFNPFSEITRQDMMVICARGMRLATDTADTANLEQFSDAATVADYAVAGIAAMLRANIVKGNADGTINPRGNTTRAEAAVIMDRITNTAGDL